MLEVTSLVPSTKLCHGLKPRGAQGPCQSHFQFHTLGQAKLTVVQLAVSVHTYHWWKRDSRFGCRDRVDHVKASMPALTLFRTASGRLWDGLVVRDIILPEVLNET
jgi:hypothetical protein